jgi:hypothetical protein
VIRTGNNSLIGKFMQDLSNGMRSHIRQCMELIYYMRGSVSYEEVMFMSVPEREIMADFVNQRLKEASKMSNPVF